MPIYKCMFNPDIDNTDSIATLEACQEHIAFWGGTMTAGISYLGFGYGFRFRCLGNPINVAHDPQFKGKILIIEEADDGSEGGS